MSSPQAPHNVHSLLKTKSPTESTREKLTLLRIALLLSLVLTAVLGGYFSYSILLRHEERIEELSFDAVSVQIEESSRDSFTAKVKSLGAFRAYLETNCPTLASWPNCTVDIDNYNIITNGFSASTDIDRFNHAALTASNQLDSLAAHVTAFYNLSGYSDVAGWVQPGVFARNDTTREKFYVEEPDPLGENGLILPMIQISFPRQNGRILMYNTYSGSLGLGRLDSLWSCMRSFNGTQQADNFTIDDICVRCMTVTTVRQLIVSAEPRPSAYLVYPTILEVDATTDVDITGGKLPIVVNGRIFVVVGVLHALFYWDIVLTKSVSRKTNGLEVMLHAGTADYFYTYQDGIAVFQPHKTSSSSSHLLEAFPITSLSNNNFDYTLTIRGDNTFSNKYYTNGPIFASLLFVAAVVFCMSIYFFYDRQTTKKWAENDQAKRNFVRYISHEIRTPLTTVKLGIQLTKKELQSLRLLPSSRAKPPNASADQPQPPPSPHADPLHGNMSISTNKHTNTASKRAIARHFDEKILTFTNFPDTLHYTSRSFLAVDSVEDSVEVAVLILNDLLDYNKIHNGNLFISSDYMSAIDFVNEIRNYCLRAAVTLVVKNLDASGCIVSKEVGRDVENLGMLPRSSSLDLPVTPLMLFGDAAKLQRVMQKLISHSIQHTLEGGEVTVTILWSKKEIHGPGAYDLYSSCGSFVVTIEDNGFGYSKENLKAVFSDGWQFKANMLQCDLPVSQGGEGSGLGMWISKNIVEAHSGSLTCQSKGLGKGSTMRLELPSLMRRSTCSYSTLPDDDCSSPGPVESEKSEVVGEEIRDKQFTDEGWALGHQPDIELLNFDTDVEMRCRPAFADHNQLPPETELQIPSKTTRAAGKTVLVVDDSAMCRKMVCRLLRKMSYNCFEATNGSDFVDKLTIWNSEKSGDESGPDYHERIDLVLLDYEMPVMDGPTACKLLRAKGYALPIIGLTGNVLKDDIDHFIECGVNAVMTKPLTLEDFTDVLIKFDQVL